MKNNSKNKINKLTYIPPFCEIVAIIQIFFVVMKVLGVVTAPWYIVLIPLWIYLTLVLLGIIFMVIWYVIIGVVEEDEYEQR